MGKGINDFEEWLALEGVDEHEDIYALYEAVSGRDNFGNYEVIVNGDMTFVKGHTDTTLVLASEKARRALLREVASLRGDTEMDMDSWVGFERNMANPRA